MSFSRTNSWLLLYITLLLSRVLSSMDIGSFVGPSFVKRSLWNLLCFFCPWCLLFYLFFNDPFVYLLVRHLLWYRLKLLVLFLRWLGLYLLSDHAPVTQSLLGSVRGVVRSWDCPTISSSRSFGVLVTPQQLLVLGIFLNVVVTLWVGCCSEIREFKCVPRQQKEAPQLTCSSKTHKLNDDINKWFKLFMFIQLPFWYKKNSIFF